MDLKTFSEPDFDPKKWINKAWSTSGNQEKEVFVGNTVTRLQLYMKQLTNSLDETTTQIVTSIPRILQDASALQIEGALLQQRLLSLEDKVQGVEEQTGHSIDSLQRIDQLKTRLENAASALREADKWAALATSLEDILESGVPTDPAKLRELADQTASMTATLELLVDAPDYEMKRLQLETLYNRLEAAVSPHLIDALSQVDADKTSTYVVLLTHMSRLPSAHRCWRRAAAARLAGAWGRRETHSARALARTLADEANTQLDWLTNVLKSETPVSELMRLYTDLLLSLEPSPTKVVSANMKLCSSPEESILLLTDLKRDLDEFVTCIRGIMESPRQNKETVPPATVLELGRAVYAPLRHLLPQYTALQTQLLLQHLDDDSIKQSDLVECSRALVSLCERSRGWLETAAGNARGVAGGAMAVYYGPAEETFITALSSHISSHFRRIETAFLTTIGSGQTPGVLSHTFPSALLLETAAAVLLDSLTEHLEEPTPPHPLLDLPLLLEAPPRAGAERQACVAALKRSKDQVRGLARAILRHPVDAQLDKIPQLSVWSNNDALSTDLPDFALSPQEYITEIGQYLMTLPQHLELHLSEKQAPWQFLAEVCTHTCDVYAEKILNIRNMDALGTKRCLTDIVYLSSVVEDLGTNVTSSLKNLEKSLRATAPASSE